MVLGFPLFFLGFATLLFPVSFFAAALFTWLGAVQLLNAASNRFFSISPIHWLHAMSFEPFALLTVAISRLIPSRDALSGNGRPILLVHGYINHGSVWILQKNRLKALGFGPIFTIHLGHPFSSIRSHAEKVQAKAEAIAKETGNKNLILIGHSMGGLASSWYATKLAPAGSAIDVITIGSPLAGTPVARIGFGQCAREMEPGSSFLQELQTAIAQNRTVRFYHIATHADQIVIPGASAAITTNKHLVLKDIGHASLLYSRRVTNQIAAWIDEVH